MIWKRLKKSTKEQEQQFEEGLDELNVTFREKLIMTLTAYVVIVIPCLLVLVGLSLFMMWVMGLL